MRLPLMVAVLAALVPVDADAEPITLSDAFAVHASWSNCQPDCMLPNSNTSPVSLELDLVLTPTFGSYMFPPRGLDNIPANDVLALSGWFNGYAVSLSDTYAGDGSYFNYDATGEPTEITGGMYFLFLTADTLGDFTVMWDFGNNKMFAPDGAFYQLTRPTVTPIDMPVPEPSTLTLLVSGLLLATRRRNRRQLSTQ